MGIDKIEIPVGLRFGLSDGLFPTPNRESLIYSQEAKKVIKSKITELANYMAETYNKSVSGDGEVDILSVLNYYTNSSRYIQLFGQNYDYVQVKEFSTVPLISPKLDFINNLDLSKVPPSHFKYLLSNYKVYNRVENNRIYKVEDSSWYRKIDWRDILNAKSYSKIHLRVDGGLKVTRSLGLKMY